ncbi:MAG: bifunctional adenosylcobinamide kinase/adenosylcobinamide-phosphate guanylyltransferase [Clostridium sp.]|nr:bifunctional adenosylcobinamide kinase/adenosylcobinamide-phosphate guanylyltransferase [Clostridium sp.]MCM1546995.1 bifunctional adenosylcobinamide kinase/adenosylcobinamide-phosphate guanylyltransferase [Ruminococcus sp.]
MFILITGGCKNGKSAIAEKIICSVKSERFYIAAMQPFGKEAEAAIKRHRKMRDGKNFKTIEKYTNIGEITLPDKSSVLLECMGNLCANEMFSAKCAAPAEKIIQDTIKLIENSQLFIAVTSQVGSDGIVYPKETMKYMESLGRLNSELSNIADIVIEAVFGIPVILKGELPECLC